MKPDKIAAAHLKLVGQQPARDAQAWRLLIQRQFPSITWRESEKDFTTPAATCVHSIATKQEQFLFGLIQKTMTRVAITKSWDDLETEDLLLSLGLVLQAQSHLRRAATSKIGTSVRGPKSELGSLRALLKADIFTTLVLYGAGQRDVVRKRARRRAEALLTCRHGPDPSLFALPLTLDTTHLVLPSIDRKSHVIDRFFLAEAMARAEDICRCVDPTSLRDWYGFGQAAQDMAWRGASKRTILGAAFLADAPNIRTIALMVAELTNLTAHSADQFGTQYSSFAEHEVNERAHAQAMDEQFDWVMAQDPLIHGSRLFVQAAEKQISALQKGQVLGWCADALHESAKAFDHVGANTPEAIEAARAAFDDCKNRNTWDGLQRLGEQIVDQCRKGLLMDVRDIYALATGQSELDGLRHALDAHLILTDIPVQRPHVAPVFSGPAARPATPAPIPTLAPAIPTMMPAGPSGMGNGGGALYVAAQDKDGTE